MNNFVKGMLISGSAPVAVGVLAAVGPLVEPGDEGALITSGMFWTGGVIVFVVCLVVGLRSRTFRTKDGKAGVLTGIGLAVVALGASCFAMNA